MFRQHAEITYKLNMSLPEMFGTLGFGFWNVCVDFTCSVSLIQKSKMWIREPGEENNSVGYCRTGVAPREQEREDWS